MSACPLIPFDSPLRAGSSATSLEDDVLRAAHMALGLADVGRAGEIDVFDALLEQALITWTARFEHALRSDAAPSVRLKRIAKLSVQFAKAEPVLLDLLRADLPLRFSLPTSEQHRKALLQLQRAFVYAIHDADCAPGSEEPWPAAEAVLAGWLKIVKALPRTGRDQPED